ncbi:MAG TPA: relaxase/mobilization nuclease domain-containing protein [Bryobacteraceae bacterium]|jgi:hypothetical protein|nr:relaxase/mobilization nuclease domain-containing protein [Bryobacteraceae bacterium]
MIAKGASRSGPRQLAVYLMRVERWDTGEPAELLELRSPWAAGIDGGDRHHTANQLIEAFRDWQTLVEGTKQGRDGLYHAEINPEAHYARNMTPEQWKRAADILGEELGLQDQPCALVLHAGKDDRPHLHVVWQRTDVDTMKVISDGYNYVAHERASQRMELEFGHEIIPGKHAKRDRKKQEEFPRQKLTQDEDQFQKRTGLSKEQRIEQLTTLRAATDSGPAFKSALEDAGYILAKGDRGYVVVDQKGGHSVLSRNVGLKKKEIEAFMAGVELDKLPTIEEAKATQAERRKALSKSNGQPARKEQTVEASKFLPPQTTQRQPQPQPIQAQEDAELEALKKALAERQAKDVQKWADFHAHELYQLEHEQNVLYKDKAADFAAMQQQEQDALKARHAEQRTGIKGIIDAIQNRWNPGLGAEKTKERRREIAQLKRRQDQERKDYLALLEQNKQLEIDGLKERQALRRHDEELKRADEQERYVREHHEAKRIIAEIEAQRIQDELERKDSLEDGPPPPKLGK